MPRIRKADCCEYRDEIKKQAIKKLPKKVETKKGQRVVNLFNDCQDDDEDIEDQKYNENKRFQKPPKYFTFAEEMIEKIKPSIEDRLQYIDERHVCCFLEPSEIEKSKCRSKISGAPSQHPKTRRKEKVRLDVQPSKLNTDKNKGEEGEEARKAENNQNDPKDDESKKMKKREKENYKDSIWCPKLKRMKKSMLKFQDSELTESDCEDSICSFDSQINLSGLSLTKEDNEKIEEMRRKKVQSSAEK